MCNGHLQLLGLIRNLQLIADIVNTNCRKLIAIMSYKIGVRDIPLLLDTVRHISRHLEFLSRPKC